MHVLQTRLAISILTSIADTDVTQTRWDSSQRKVLCMFLLKLDFTSLGNSEDCWKLRAPRRSTNSLLEMGSL